MDDEINGCDWNLMITWSTEQWNCALDTDWDVLPGTTIAGVIIYCNVNR